MGGFPQRREGRMLKKKKKRKEEGEKKKGEKELSRSNGVFLAQRKACGFDLF